MIEKLIKFPISNSIVTIPFIFFSTQCIGYECRNVRFSDVTNFLLREVKIILEKGLY